MPLPNGVSTLAEYFARPRTVVGYFDTGATQRDLDAIKPITVAQARVLLAAAIKVLTRAIELAGSLPGDGKRQEALWKLRYYADRLSKPAPGDSVFPEADDLKRWVNQAFIEFNAVETGTAYAQENWNAMIAEVKARAVAVAETGIKAVEAAGKGAAGTIDFFQKMASLPWYGWAAIGVGGVLLVGGAAFLVSRARR